jgi:hypothetical protein
MTDEQQYGLLARPGRNLTDEQLKIIVEHIMSIGDVWSYIVANHDVSWYPEYPVDMNARLWGEVRAFAIQQKLLFYGDDQLRLADLLRQCASSSMSKDVNQS